MPPPSPPPLRRPSGPPFGAPGSSAGGPALVSRKRFRDQAHVTNQQAINHAHLPNGAGTSYRADFLPSRNIPHPSPPPEVTMRDLAPHEDDEEFMDDMDIPHNGDASDHVNMLANPGEAGRNSGANVTKEDAVFVPFYPHLLGSDFDDSDLM